MANTGLLSKSTRGLKQSDVIKDQQFKLVYVYPMLVDSTLGKYSDLFRNFLTTTMLKEIFISNSLNLVNIASQIHPLVDEKGNAVDIRSTLTSGSSDNIFGGSGFQQHPLDYMKSELAVKIHEKTAIIRKLLNADPRLILP